MSCDCNTLVIGEAGAPGPQGLTGINGTNGTNGINAFTTVIAPAQNQPPIGTTVTFFVAENRWMAIGQTLYIQEAGFYRVISLGSGPSYSQVEAELLNFDGVNQGDSIPVGLKVSPSSAVSLTTGTFDDLAVSEGGLSNLDGPVVINESGTNSAHLRVESDNDTELLYCNASTGRVGISTLAPEATLDVDGTFKVGTNAVPSSSSFIGPVTVNTSQLSASDFLVKGVATAETFFVDVSASRVGIGTYTPNRLLDVAGSAQAISFVVNPGGITSASAATFRVNGTNSTVPIYVKSVTSPSVLNAVGIFNVNPTASLDVTGTAAISGATTVGGLATLASLTVTGATSLSSTLSVTGATTLSSTLIVTGATSLSSTLNVTGATSLSSSLIVNTDDFVVNTSDHRVGINKANPAVALDVVGETNISSSLTVNTDDFVVDADNHRVGINKANPAVALDVVGAATITGDTSIGSNVLKVDSFHGWVGINKANPAVELDIAGRTRISESLTVNTNDFVVDTDNGFVGINIASPTVELDVVGETKISSNLFVNTDDFVVDASNHRVGINKSNPAVALDVVGTTNISSNLTVNTDDFVVDATNHKVGINTASPTVDLDVVGSAQATDYRISTGSGAAKLTGFYFASTTIASIGSISAGATNASSVITVQGAVLGDFVQVTYGGSLPVTNFKNIVTVSGYVSDVDEVTILLANNSAGATTAQTDLPFNILVTRAAAS
jgi:hypothetical protein